MRAMNEELLSAENIICESGQVIISAQIVFIEDNTHIVLSVCIFRTVRHASDFFEITGDRWNSVHNDSAVYRDDNICHAVDDTRLNERSSVEGNFDCSRIRGDNDTVLPESGNCEWYITDDIIVYLIKILSVRPGGSLARI